MRTGGVRLQHRLELPAHLVNAAGRHVGAARAPGDVRGRWAAPTTSAAVWAKTHVTNVEAFGAGTLAHDPETGGTIPHIHVSAGLKAQSADGRTSHLLAAKVQFLSELLVVEVTSPVMTRPRNANLYDVPLLTFN